MYQYPNVSMKISPAEAKRLIIENPNILLLDVRSQEEYIRGHIPGSFNIPVEYLPWQIMNLPLSIYTPIIVYCKTGIRASSDVNILLGMGFINVFNLGGIVNWPYTITRW